MLLCMTNPATNSTETLKQLEEERIALRHEIETWRLQAGPVRLSRRLGSMRLAKYFIGFHLSVALVGTAHIFRWRCAEPGNGDGHRDALWLWRIYWPSLGLQVERERWLEDEVRAKVNALDARLDAMKDQGSS
jgi:hypothetical protein